MFMTGDAVRAIPAVGSMTGWPAFFTRQEGHIKCTWLVETGRDEDGEMVVVECGAHAVTIEYEGVFGTGFRCEVGHHLEPLEIELAPFGPEWEREREYDNGWTEARWNEV